MAMEEHAVYCSVNMLYGCWSTGVLTLRIAVLPRVFLSIGFSQGSNIAGADESHIGLFIKRFMPKPAALDGYGIVG